MLSDPIPHEVSVGEWQFGAHRLECSNRRVQYRRAGFGRQEFKSIFLREVTAVSLGHTSHLILLILAPLLGLAGLFSFSSKAPLGVGLCFSAAACILAFVLTRQSVVRVSTAGEAILFPILGSRVETALLIVQEIDRAKGALGD